MQARIQSVLQVVVALLCAMGASFSGDLYAHHSRASHQSSRHTRGTHHRGNRGVSRSGYDDYSADVEVLKADHAHAPPGADAAVVPAAAPAFLPVWVEAGMSTPLTVSAVASTPLPEWAPRGPPALS